MKRNWTSTYEVILFHHSSMIFMTNSFNARTLFAVSFFCFHSFKIETLDMTNFFFMIYLILNCYTELHTLAIWYIWNYFQLSSSLLFDYYKLWFVIQNLVLLFFFSECWFDTLGLCPKFPQTWHKILDHQMSLLYSYQEDESKNIFLA